jgi:hypothetical protein
VDELNSLEVAAKKRNPDVQKCRAGEDCGDFMAKITTHVTRWIRLPLLDDGTELVHVRSLL